MKPILFSLALIFSFAVHAQKPTLPDEVKASIEKRIALGINPSIVVGLINADGSSYFSFGVKKTGGEPVNEHSIYEIGSISKTFTATLLADEVLKGEMSLDDPAQKYLPETVQLPTYEGESIKLGNLSDHTSSLPRMPTNFHPADPMNPYADYTLDQLFEFLSSYKLTRPIGSEYEYSNLAVGLLGQILSRKAGTSYEELMLSKIGHPLHMDETKITLDANMKKNLAYGYAGGQEVENWDLPTLAGAGAIRSSAFDLLKYIAAEMNLTSTSLHEAMTLTHQPRHNKVGGKSIGLNWFIDDVDGEKIFEHGGATGGYRAFVGFTDKIGIVLLTNSDEDADDIGMHLLDAKIPIRETKPKVTSWIMETIEKNGTKKLVDQYDKMKKEKGDFYSIDENDINTLGYQYMNEKKDLKAATAVFEINMKEFPASFNVYDSYAEALMNAGNKKEAIENYKKSLELNPGNNNGVEMLAKLGVAYEVKAPVLTAELLATYDGTYELAPGFNLVITHDGTRLFGQATGQGQFELFPKSNTEFYLKVTEASVTFAKNDAGVMGLTLFQGGAVMPGKKL
jgi:serine-type D-Ala-D-Ala carboxypeptidase/endopeptidase